MPVKLSDLEVDLLRKLVNGEAVSVSSHQRIRLELAGVIRDGARGMVVTAEGRELARRDPAKATVSSLAGDVKIARDDRGRRMSCSLDDPDALPPAHHVWTREKPRWSVINDGLPAFQFTRPKR